MSGISSSIVRKNKEFVGIFRHHVNSSQLEAIQSTISDLAAHCITRQDVSSHFPHINEPTGKVVDTLGCTYISDFNYILYYGTFTIIRPKKPRSPNSSSGTIADILAWKWSEATGKFIGCPFWSLAAKNLFSRELTNYHAPSLEDAWRLADRLAIRKGRPREQQLTHEHVFPKQFFCEMLRTLPAERTCGISELRELFARFAVACVVLESEHPPNSLYDRVNPWQRYGGRGITLVKNPDWPEEHKNLIDLAELQVVPL